MSKTIQILSSQTINQIAAGEVIENPASVVKELVENSIDAGAKKITVEILGGGFQSIQVSDDGKGMSPADAALCIERHATSKLQDADDLFCLTTMGFRGEALASIASISKLELSTAKEGDTPIQIRVEGGNILSIDPTARSRGTAICVRSLFFNVPARKKFQKSATASSAEITKTMTQLALAHPEVGFELIAQERTVFSHPAAEKGAPLEQVLSERVKALLGEEFLSYSTPLTIEEREFSLFGFVAKPEQSRPNRSGQSLFINRRPIFCPSISYAVRDAYGTRLQSDRHPQFLLHFTLNPALVDVNVHPQKKEVRLREESRLKYRLHAAIQEALTPETHLARDLQTTDFQWPFEPSTPFRFEEIDLPVHTEMQVLEENPLPLDIKMQPIGVYSHYLLVDASTVLIDGRKGIMIFDLPTAETAICFENLLERKTQPLSQRLLFPLTLSFSQQESEWLLTGIEEILNLGIEMHQVGQGAFLIEAIPPFLEEGEVKELLHELIGTMQQLERERFTSFARTLSLRIKRKQRSYGQEEAVHIVKTLLQLKNSHSCPRGRPTMHFLEENEIGAFFRAH